MPESEHNFGRHSNIDNVCGSGNKKVSFNYAKPFQCLNRTSLLRGNSTMQLQQPNPTVAPPSTPAQGQERFHSSNQVPTSSRAKCTTEKCRIMHRFFTDLNDSWKPQHQEIVAAPCQCNTASSNNIVPDSCGLLYTRFRANHLDPDDCPMTVDGYGTGEANFPSITDFRNIRVLNHPGNRQRQFTSRCYTPLRENCFGTGIKWNGQVPCEEPCRPARDPVSCCRNRSRNQNRHNRRITFQYEKASGEGVRNRRDFIIECLTSARELSREQNNNFGQQMGQDGNLNKGIVAETQTTTPQTTSTGQQYSSKDMQSEEYSGVERAATPLHSCRGKETLPSIYKQDFADLLTKCFEGGGSALLSSSIMPQSTKSKEVFNSFIAQMQAAGKVSKVDAERMIKLVNNNLVLNSGVSALTISSNEGNNVSQPSPHQCTEACNEGCPTGLRRGMGTDVVIRKAVSKPKLAVRKQKGTCTEDPDSHGKCRRQLKQMEVCRTKFQPSMAGIMKCPSSTPSKPACTRLSQPSVPGIPKCYSKSVCKTTSTPGWPKCVAKKSQKELKKKKEGEIEVIPPPPDEFKDPKRSFVAPPQPIIESPRNSSIAPAPPSLAEEESRRKSSSVQPPNPQESPRTSSTVQPPPQEQSSRKSSKVPSIPPEEDSPRISSTVPQPSLPSQSPRQSSTVEPPPPSESSKRNSTVPSNSPKTISDREPSIKSNKASTKEGSSSSQKPSSSPFKFRPTWADEYSTPSSESPPRSASDNDNNNNSPVRDQTPELSDNESSLDWPKPPVQGPLDKPPPGPLTKPREKYKSPYNFKKQKLSDPPCEVSFANLPKCHPLKTPYPPQYRFDEFRLRRYQLQCGLLKKMCSKKKQQENQCYTPSEPPKSSNPVKFKDFPPPDKCSLPPLFPGRGFPDGSYQYPYNNNNNNLPPIQSGNIRDNFFDCGGVCPMGMLNEPRTPPPPPPPYSKLKKKKKQDETFLLDYITVRKDKNANQDSIPEGDYCDSDRAEEETEVSFDEDDYNEDYRGQRRIRRNPYDNTNALPPSDEITRFLKMKNVQAVKEQKTEIVTKHSGEKPQRLVTQMDAYYTKMPDGRIRVEPRDPFNNNNNNVNAEQWAKEDDDMDLRRLLQQNAYQTAWEREFKEFEMSCNRPRYKVRPPPPRPPMPGFLQCPLPETMPLMCRNPAAPTSSGRILCQTIPFPARVVMGQQRQDGGAYHFVGGGAAAAIATAPILYSVPSPPPPPRGFDDGYVLEQQLSQATLFVPTPVNVPVDQVQIMQPWPNDAARMEYFQEQRNSGDTQPVVTVEAQQELSQVLPLLDSQQHLVLQQPQQQRDYPYTCEIRYQEPIHGSIYGKVVTRRQPCRLIDPENQEVSNEREPNYPVIMETPFFNPSCPQRNKKPKDKMDKNRKN